MPNLDTGTASRQLVHWHWSRSGNEQPDFWGQLEYWGFSLLIMTEFVPHLNRFASSGEFGGRNPRGAPFLHNQKTLAKLNHQRPPLPRPQV